MGGRPHGNRRIASVWWTRRKADKMPNSIKLQYQILFDAKSIFPARKDKNLIFIPFYFNTQANLLAIYFQPATMDFQLNRAYFIILIRELAWLH